MSRKSDIAICQFEHDMDRNITVCINGWSICKISYDEDILIKTKEDAIEIAKGIVSLLEFKYGEVRNEDFPNMSKASPDVEVVEGYELPQYSEEEWAEKEKELENDADALIKLLSLMCD